MLAARSRGLGTCWTTFHLAHEQEAAELLGIPYDEVMQAALIPVAYTIGTDFKPAVAGAARLDGALGPLVATRLSAFVRTSHRRRDPRRAHRRGRATRGPR